MKLLLVLRHAKSSWNHPELADHDRPLNKRGKRDAPRMGELLREEDMLPDLILSSSAERARTTGDLVSEASGYEGEIRVNRDLYAHFAEAYLDTLSALDKPYERVMVIGHNPGLEELVEGLTGDWVRMPTAALAMVRLPIQGWSELSDETQGDLVNLWRPKELP
jgi:phosphohistidine phosphatase